MLEVISLFLIGVDFFEVIGICGTAQATQEEMSDGWTKFTHKQQWLVKIEASYKNSKKESVKEKCLGAAITEKWVLTAAACVEKEER